VKIKDIINGIDLITKGIGSIVNLIDIFSRVFISVLVCKPWYAITQNVPLYTPSPFSFRWRHPQSAPTS